MLYKELEKVIREIAFEQGKKNPGLKFNSGLALIGLRTTKLGPELISDSLRFSLTSKIHLLRHKYQMPALSR